MPTLAQTPIPSQCDRILALLKEGKSQNRKIPFRAKAKTGKSHRGKIRH